MRRVVVLALLALALPMAATADIIMMNQGGTIAISNMAGTGGLGMIGASTITSKGSQLTQFNSFTGHLGTVNYSTGTLPSGSVSRGGTFSCGGTFDIFGIGAWAKTVTGCAILQGSDFTVHWQFLRSGYLDPDSAGKNEGILFTQRHDHRHPVEWSHCEWKHDARRSLAHQGPTERRYRTH